nr:MAG TPA: hypothetical protein [Inoviridae sp.]
MVHISHFVRLLLRMYQKLFALLIELKDLLFRIQIPSQYANEHA